MGKPLLFGDPTLDASRIESIRRLDDTWDRSYVPGYSEARRANEWAVRDGKKPIPMDRLQWIRIGHTDGREIGDRDMLEWALNGYQFITESELKSRGWGMPPTAFVDSQGRIRREDLALAFVDEAQARKNVERRNALANATPAAHPDNEEIQWETRIDEHGDIGEIGARHLN